MGYTSRQWVDSDIENAIADYTAQQLSHSSDAIYNEILTRIDENRQIHEQDCINLNPGTNAMNPRAEAVLSQGLGRPSLGYPGDKYEMGLEGIERIEMLAAGLACEIFQADYAEIRVPSGAMGSWI